MVAEFEPFQPQLTVAEILQRWPDLYPVFKAEGMGACLGCPIAPFESVAEAAVACRQDPARVALALQTAFAELVRN